MREIIIIVIALFTIFFLFFYDAERVYVRSSIDNRLYHVRDLDDKHIAADVLCVIRSNLIILVDSLYNKYRKDENVIRLKQRFNPNNIKEANSDKRFTSFTSNKGEKIVMCIRSRHTSTYDKIHEQNLLMKVALHELAHVMSKSISKEKHNEEFYKNYDFIIKEATLLGIYEEDSRNKEYCGITVN